MCMSVGICSCLCGGASCSHPMRPSIQGVCLRLQVACLMDVFHNACFLPVLCWDACCQYMDSRSSPLVATAVCMQQALLAGCCQSTCSVHFWDAERSQVGRGKPCSGAPLAVCAVCSLSGSGDLLQRFCLFLSAADNTSAHPSRTCVIHSAA
jgi:hypothetical protein